MIRAFANGMWFYAVQAEQNGFDPTDPNSDEELMCRGCVFFGRGHTACKNAEIAALNAGVPDCESRGANPGYRYLRDPSDGRQEDMLLAAGV